MHPTEINEKIFSHFIAEKIIFRIIIYCNNIFDTNSISRGYLTKLQNNGKFQGLGGGGGGVGWQALLERKFQRGGGSTSLSAPRGGEGRGGKGCIFSVTTHFGFTLGKSLCLNVVSISRLFFCVQEIHTLFHISHIYVGSQGKYGENYSGHIF